MHVNAFTDDERSKLSNVESGAQANIVNEAPTDGEEYVRKNAVWSAVSSTGGTTERITAIRSASLSVTSETVISFDPAQTANANGLTINVGGNLECIVSGYYQGSIKFYINENSDPTHYAWLEIKPLITRIVNGATYTGGVWNLIPASLFKFKITNDAGMIVPLNGGLDIITGDEVRFKGRATSGTSTLQTQTDTAPALGTTTQFAAVLNLWKVGEVTP